MTGAKRDLGLDRMMVDTLSSGSPGYGQESVANPGRPANDSWVYPGLAPTRTQPQ